MNTAARMRSAATAVDLMHSDNAPLPEKFHAAMRCKKGADTPEEANYWQQIASHYALAAARELVQAKILN
ncbi:MAG: hypothetical protein LCH59_10915 [Proteobacteria bacterium]|nr:hypothetical protein [Pseudomonadota bacterium]